MRKALLTTGTIAYWYLYICVFNTVLQRSSRWPQAVHVVRYPGTHSPIPLHDRLVLRIHSSSPHTAGGCIGLGAPLLPTTVVTELRSLSADLIAHMVQCVSHLLTEHKLCRVS